MRPTISILLADAVPALANTSRVDLMGEDIQSNEQLAQGNNIRSPTLGERIYGLGVAAIAVVNLALGAFDPMQPIPDALPGRTALIYGTSTLILLAGVGILWRHTAAWSAAVLTIYFGVMVALLENGRVIIAQYAVYGAYFGVAEGPALAAAGLIIFSSSGPIEPVSARRLTRVGQLIFGVCALFSEVPILSIPKLQWHSCLRGCRRRKSFGRMLPVSFISLAD